ncbi:hypothetical protein KIPB_011734, partial [Kipferlia bialata]
VTVFENETPRLVYSKLSTHVFPDMRQVIATINQK